MNQMAVQEGGIMRSAGPGKNAEKMRKMRKMRKNMQKNAVCAYGEI